MRIMPLVSMRNYVAVAPRGTLIADATSPSGCFGWQQARRASQPGRDANLRQHRPGDAEAEHRAAADFSGGLRLRRHHGLSRGDEASGGLCRGAFLGRVVSHRLHAVGQADRGAAAADLPSGRPPQHRLSARRVCDDLRLLHAAGLSITLRDYPCGQELPPQMLSDVDRWVIEQIQAAASATAEAEGLGIRD